MLVKNGIIVAPGAYDALSAKIIEKVGFSALYLTGFGISASLLGRPDIGLLTLNDIVNHVKNIDNTVELPIIADAESGFGNAINVMRTITEYEKAGAVAIHIEDRNVPRRWKLGALSDVVSRKEHVDKIRAAVIARKDTNFLIIGRTDARDRHGINEALQRANLYLEAGADLAFVHGPQSMEELKLICKEVNGLNIINYGTMVELRNMPIPSLTEVEKIGFKVAIFPITPLLAIAQSLKDILKILAEKRTIKDSLNRLMDIEEYNLIIDKLRFEKWEKKYLPNGMP